MKYKDIVRDRYKPMEIVPLWKGFVKYDIYTDGYLVAPVPFNLVFMTIADFYDWLRGFNWRRKNFIKKQRDLRKEI